VEDDEVLANVVAGALRGRGYPVDIVGTGGEALDRVSATEPKVVVLDLGLPDIDGIDVCRRLRRWFAEPIVVLSADGDEGRKVTALDEGADDYVTKPFSMAELMARLRVAVRHHQAELGPAPVDGVRLGDLHIDVTGHRATRPTRWPSRRARPAETASGEAGPRAGPVRPALGLTRRRP
jgi:two-component system KDP operon response regulator KdpE